MMAVYQAESKDAVFDADAVFALSKELVDTELEVKRLTEALEAARSAHNHAITRLSNLKIRFTRLVADRLDTSSLRQIKTMTDAVKYTGIASSKD